MRRIPYTGPNIAGYWSLVIKVYKKRGGAAPLKGSDLVSCHPQFRRGNKFKSPQEGCNKNETRIETVLGGEEERLEGLRGCEGVGSVSGRGVIWRLAMMMAMAVMRGFKLSATYMWMFVKLTKVFGSFWCIFLKQCGDYTNNARCIEY